MSSVDNKHESVIKHFPPNNNYVIDQNRFRDLLLLPEFEDFVGRL